MFFSCFQVNATTPKSVTVPELNIEKNIFLELNKARLRESYEVDVVIPCKGESKVDDNDCSDGSFIGGLLGAGIALSSSKGKIDFGRCLLEAQQEH